MCEENSNSLRTLCVKKCVKKKIIVDENSEIVDENTQWLMNEILINSKGNFQLTYTEFFHENTQWKVIFNLRTLNFFNFQLLLRTLNFFNFNLHTN